jgi:hypothetical protein
MNSDDPDRAAILARRRRLILLALAGAAEPFATACGRPNVCLSVRDPDSDRDPMTTACPAELGPSMSLLNDTQIRLPVGITPDSVVEIAPGVVRLAAPVESVSCIHWWPGGTINYFAMTYVVDDPSKSLPALRDELLVAFGYVAPAFSAEVIDEVGRSYEVVIDQPSSSVEPEDEGEANSEPVRAFLSLEANAGRIYAVIYEVPPWAWSALQASLRASAASLSFSKRD